MKKSWIGSLFFCVGALILAAVDHLAWEESHLAQYIGQFGGVNSFVDEQINPVIGPYQQRLYFENKLKATDDPAVYAKTALELHGLLGKMNRPREQDAVIEELLERHGGVGDKNIDKAWGLLMDRLIGEKDLPALEQWLKRFREYAKGPPVSGKRLMRALNWATKAGLAEFAIEMAEEMLALPGISHKDKLSLVQRLKPHYLAAGNSERVAELDEQFKELTRTMKLSKVIDQQLRLVKQLIGDGNLANAIDQCRLLLQDYPDYRLRIEKEALNILVKTAQENKPDQAWRMWEALIESPPPAHSEEAGQPDPNRIERWDTAVASSSQVLRRNGQAQHFLKMAHFVLSSNLVNEMRRYLESELWALEARKGQPPQAVYRVVFRPDADIVLDGHLNEAVYDTVTPIPDPFWQAWHDTTIDIVAAPESLQPTVRMFHTSDALHIAIRCPEPDMNRLKFTIPAGPNERPWEDDSVEVFLDWTRNLYKFDQHMVSAGGAFLSLKELTWSLPGRWGIDGKELYDLTCGTTRDKESYTLEMRIPLPEKPPEGDSWSGALLNANIRRMRYPPGTEHQKESLEIITWAPAEVGHRIDMMNFLEFE